MRKIRIRNRLVFTVRSKLIGAFGLVFVLLAGLGGFALFELETVNRSSTELGEAWLPSVRAVGNLNARVAEFRIAESALLLAETDEEKDKAEAEMKAIRDSIIESQGIFEPLISSDDEEAAYKGFKRLWGKYVDTDKDIVALSRQHQNDEANDLFRGKAQEIYAKAAAKMNELVEVNAKSASDATATGQTHYVFTRKLIIATIAAGAVISLLLAWLIVRSVSRPVTLMTTAMRRLGEGDKTIAVPGLSRKDEIGGMARALEVFKETAIRTEALEAEQARERQAMREARAQNVESLTREFDSTVGAIVNTVSSASTEMQSTATAMTATAEETLRQSAAAAAASEEASSNVQTAASAVDALSKSVGEVSRRVAQSSAMAAQAVTESERTNALVRGLADAAQKIGAVTNLISEIASQTNLLALNATIEAARAGEAGRGFAVVASEVKTLANQTAKATEEITAHIAAMQSATGETVTAIQSIGATIDQINEIASVIATAVEEQGAATDEIARNTLQAAAGTKEVAGNISSVTDAAGETGAAAAQVLGAAGELSKQSETLRAQVDRFLVAMKAA